MEGDSYRLYISGVWKKFQPTPSVGRATRVRSRAFYFNPRPPWGGRLRIAYGKNMTELFQSTPSVGRATRHLITPQKLSTFQSTPSVGRATRVAKADRFKRGISIHALRGEGDLKQFLTMRPMMYFNPRPPWGGRPPTPPPKSASQRFQSTPSVGRATSNKIRLFSIE